MEHVVEPEVKTIDLNYEEISLDRSINGGRDFANGLLNYRFSVAPTGGGCIIPSQCYMLIEYNFGSAVGASDAYTATQPLKQSQKIALQNNWASCLFTGCRYTVAQSEIGVVNSNHAQLSTLKQRMRRTTSFLEHLGYDLNGIDPDFSRRLARTCSDGVYHRDGLIDCSPYMSNPLSPDQKELVQLYTQAETDLPLVNSGLYYSGSRFETTLKAGAVFQFMSKNTAFDISAGGTGEIKDTDGNLAQAVVSSIQWLLPEYSGLPGTVAQNSAVIDGTLIVKEDLIKFYVDPSSAQKIAFNLLSFRVGDIKTVGNRIALDLIPRAAGGGDIKLVPNDLINVFDASPLAVSGIVSVIRKNFTNPYYQPDPRSGVVNGMIAYQPPISFFEISDPTVFFGDIEIQMTPNSNWQNACVESAVPGTYYGSDVKHGVDYAFGIKSMRLYLARARLTITPPQKSLLSIPDYQISNKQLPSGSSTINFNLPPSTRKIVIFVQDSAVGTNSKLPLTRFKTRQYTGTNGLTALNRYGPFANTLDERLQSLQLNFKGINKPVTLFQKGGQGEIGDGLTISMLQRWMMTNYDNDNRQEPEKFNDWLSCGPYYVYDFDTSADNSGTYLTVNVTYKDTSPGLTDGANATSTTPSNINLYVCSIYDRDIALTYNQYGVVVSAQTQMR